ncbi:MAG: Txe/YoeB family addiction module toxin [Bacilli bacterium]|nr:Txe/YoeB family addiction module toxin [Bacilli bacterium]
MYKIVVSKQAIKDFPNLSSAGLAKKAKASIELLKENPFQNPPSYEKLIGDMEGLYSRRINLKHRLVYQVYEEEKIVKIVSAWSHYENV